MINWKRVPLLRLLLPFMFGIAIALHFNWRFDWLPYLLIIYLIVLFRWAARPLFDVRFSFGYAVQPFLLLFGYYLTYQFHAERCPNYLPAANATSIYLTGTITEIPQRRKWLRLVIELENGGEQLDSLRLGCGQLLTYLEPDSTDFALSYGDKIVFRGTIQRITTPRNPHTFDTHAYYFKENIHHQIFVKKGDWRVVAHGVGNSFYATILKWRLHFVQILRTYLPEATDFSVASALILGYKNEMNAEVRTAYQVTGAAHVLAVSGLHVGLVVWLVLLLLNRIQFYHPAWRYIKSAVLILLVGLFVLLTGAPPSVRRAALLFSFVLVGKDFAQQISSFNLLACSAFVLLGFNPYIILDIGFQLSYAAMIGILYFQPRIYGAFYFPNWIIDRLWQLLSVSLAAQLLTLPLSIYYFHQIPLYFWLSSLVVIPAAGLILGLGFLLFFATAISTTLAVGVGTLLGWLISAVNWFIFWLESIPFNLISGLWWSGMVVVLIYLILFAFTVAMNKREAGFQWLQIGLVALVVISFRFAYRQFEIHHQRKIIIYHIPRRTLIDCVDQQQVFALQSDSLDAKSIAFNAGNHRDFTQVRQIENVVLTEDSTIKWRAFHYQPNLLEFYRYRIIIVDRPLAQTVVNRTKADVILLVNSPSVSVAEVMRHFEFKEIVFDGSNKFWQIEKWQKECEELNLNCYDINKQGAWMKDISS